MPIETRAIALLTITYLVHSTLLLGGAGCLMFVCRVRSFILSEHIWKLAAVLAVFTAPAQFFFMNSLTTPGVVLEIPGPPPIADIISREATSPTNTMTMATIAQSHPGTNFSTTTLSHRNEATESHPQHISGPTGAVATRAAKPSGHRSVPSANMDDGPRTSSQQVSCMHAFGVPLIATSSMICFFGGGMIFLVNTVRFHRKVACLHPLRQGSARRILTRLLKRSNIGRKVRILVSEDDDGPGAFGLFRWTIVLPRDIEQRFDKDELRALLAHELAHLVRGDVVWMWIGRLLCSFLAFQPLNFLARSRWRMAAEFQCDDWAVRQGIQMFSLAQGLTRIADWTLDRQAMLRSLGASGGTVRARVRRLINGGVTDCWRRPLRRGLLWMSTFLFVTAFFFLAPRFHVTAKVGESRGDLFVPHPSPRNHFRFSRSEADIWHTLEGELEMLDFDYQRLRGVYHRYSHIDGALTDGLTKLDQRFTAIRKRRAIIHSLMQKEFD